MTTDTNEHGTSPLIEFLRDHDAPCPLCGYDLRNLTSDVCPECRHELRLTVGVHHVRFGGFLATLAPSLFSGMAAGSLLILLLASWAAGAGPVPPVVFLLDLLGFASGAVAVALIARRHRFIRLRPRVQRAWALVAWGLHAIPFLGLVLLLVLTA